jgi:Asp-tRNA(Asn)/Glu-tRNA(Gln) amidotransferase A subunit family amidase
VAVPSGFWSNGSPSGVMFAGRLYGDGDLLALARAFERASPRATRYPPGFEPGA